MAFQDFNNLEDFIPQTLKFAQNRLIYEQKKRCFTNKMLTTVVVIVMDEKKVYAGYIGDSRLYYFNNNKIKFQTKDHMSEYKTYAVGDVNGDGVITTDDKFLVEKYLAKLVDLDQNQINAADTNGDGEITISDATAIEKFADAVTKSSKKMESMNPGRYYDEDSEEYCRSSYFDIYSSLPCETKMFHKVSGYNYKKGDIDGDGRITLCDALLVQKASAGFKIFDNANHEKAGDINNDGKIGIDDAGLLKKWVSGIKINYNLDTYVNMLTKIKLKI